MCPKKIVSLAACLAAPRRSSERPTARSEILFNTNFEGGSLGKVEVLGSVPIPVFRAGSVR